MATKNENRLVGKEIKKKKKVKLGVKGEVLKDVDHKVNGDAEAGVVFIHFFCLSSSNKHVQSLYS